MLEIHDAMIRARLAGASWDQIDTTLGAARSALKTGGELAWEPRVIEGGGQSVRMSDQEKYDMAIRLQQGKMTKEEFENQTIWRNRDPDLSTVE